MTELSVSVQPSKLILLRGVPFPKRKYWHNCRCFKIKPNNAKTHYRINEGEGYVINGQEAV